MFLIKGTPPDISGVVELRGVSFGRVCFVKSSLEVAVEAEQD